MIDADLPVLRLLRERLGASREDESAFRMGVLAAVGGTLGWVVGTLWLPDASGQQLAAGAVWTAPWHHATAFAEASRTLRFAPGRGLPGRVWVSGEPTWIVDVTVDSNFLRVDSARQDGLHSGIGIPLVSTDGQVCGVLEFFTDYFRSPLPLMLDVFREIGRTAGPVFAMQAAPGAKSLMPPERMDRTDR